MNRLLWSERPGSNRRHSAWKADALPTELLSHCGCKYRKRDAPFPNVFLDFFQKMITSCYKSLIIIELM